MTNYSTNSQKDLSKVVAYDGPRGSGKTLSMVVTVVFEMILNNMTVWSNFPIAFNFKDANGGVKHYESLPLDMNMLYAFDSELVSGIVVIDELNLWADSRRSMGVGNRLLNSIFQLIRKRRLSFLLTVQNFQWLDNRIRWQVDALVRCRDLKYIIQNYKLKPGERISQTWKDMSGIFTGFSYEERPRDYQQTLWGTPFWGCYNTYQEFDVLAAMRGVKLNLGKTEITRTDLESAYSTNNEHQLDTVRLAIQTLHEAGVTELKSEEMHAFLKDYGVIADTKVIGRLLKQCGCQYKQTRAGNLYILHE